MLKKLHTANAVWSLKYSIFGFTEEIPSISAAFITEITNGSVNADYFAKKVLVFSINLQDFQYKTGLPTHQYDFTLTVRLRFILKLLRSFSRKARIIIYTKPVDGYHGKKSEPVSLRIASAKKKSP